MQASDRQPLASGSVEGDGNKDDGWLASAEYHAWREGDSIAWLMLGTLLCLVSIAALLTHRGALGFGAAVEVDTMRDTILGVAGALLAFLALQRRWSYHVARVRYLERKGATGTEAARHRVRPARGPMSAGRLLELAVLEMRNHGRETRTRASWYFWTGQVALFVGLAWAACWGMLAVRGTGQGVGAPPVGLAAVCSGMIGLVIGTCLAALRTSLGELRRYETYLIAMYLVLRAQSVGGTPGPISEELRHATMLRLIRAAERILAPESCVAHGAIGSGSLPRSS